VVIKHLTARDCAGASGLGIGLGRIREPHGDHEHLPVRQLVERVVKGMVFGVGKITRLMSLGRRLLELRSRDFPLRAWGKYVIGDAHFHVVSLTGKNGERLVSGPSSRSG